MGLRGSGVCSQIARWPWLKWTMTSFGTLPTRLCSCIICRVCIHLAERPRQKAGAQICLKGHCWFQGESRLLASLTPPYLLSLASLFARLVRKSLDLRKRADECGESTPMAACDYDAGRLCPSVGPFFPPGPWLNFHVIQEPAADLPLRAVLLGLQSGGQDDSGHLTDSRSSLVPFGFGAARQLDTFRHKNWALQQVQLVAEKILQSWMKSAGRLKIWTQRATYLQKERLNWLQGAADTLKPLLAGIHGLF